MDWGRKWLADFNAGRTQLAYFDQPNSISGIGVKTDGSVFEEKSSLKTLWFAFSSKLD